MTEKLKNTKSKIAIYIILGLIITRVILVPFVDNRPIYRDNCIVGEISLTEMLTTRFKGGLMGFLDRLGSQVEILGSLVPKR